MSPIRSPALLRIKFPTTPFATVIRFGEISSASIESEMSNTIMISCGICFVFVVERTTLGDAMIAMRLPIVRVRMNQRIHIFFGVLRYLATRAFGCMVPIFSRPKIYQRIIITGIRIRTRGWENVKCIIGYPLEDNMQILFFQCSHEFALYIL
jgi:hypothetical protein